MSEPQSTEYTTVGRQISTCYDWDQLRLDRDRRMSRVREGVIRAFQFNRRCIEAGVSILSVARPHETENAFLDRIQPQEMDGA